MQGVFPALPDINTPYFVMLSIFEFGGSIFYVSEKNRRLCLNICCCCHGNDCLFIERLRQFF